MGFGLGIGIGLSQNNYVFGGAAPAALFAAGEPGIWLDPTDLSTMFQDAAGTIPVTAPGQRVRRILDKSGRGNHAVQADDAEAPTYAIVGGFPCLQFDGVNDSLVTPTVTPATNRVQIFAGIEKTSDAETSILLELGTDSNNSVGTFRVTAPLFVGTDYYELKMRGATLGGDVIATNPIYAAPVSNVLTGLINIGTPSIQLRINGTVIGTNTTNLGATNFQPHPLYIGRRAEDSLPFRGNLYGLVVRFGPDLTADQVAQNEAYMQERTAPVAAFSPASLFTGTDTGFWSDPITPAILWQDTARTTPVTAAGQPVGSWQLTTASGVIYAEQPIPSRRPSYEIDGNGRGRIQFGAGKIMSTPVITPGTDKMQVVLAMSAVGTGTQIFLELSPVTDNNNGSFALFQAAGTTRYRSRGTTIRDAEVGTPTPPAQYVLTGLGDISADSAILRINGTQVAQNLLDQGTGNYNNYNLYIGDREVTGIPTLGAFYGLIVRFGPPLSAPQLANAEAWADSLINP